MASAPCAARVSGPRSTSCGGARWWGKCGRTSNPIVGHCLRPLAYLATCGPLQCGLFTKPRFCIAPFGAPRWALHKPSRVFTGPFRSTCRPATGWKKRIKTVSPRRRRRRSAPGPAAPLAAPPVPTRGHLPPTSLQARLASRPGARMAEGCNTSVSAFCGVRPLRACGRRAAPTGGRSRASSPWLRPPPPGTVGNAPSVAARSSG